MKEDLDKFLSFVSSKKIDQDPEAVMSGDELIDEVNELIDLVYKYQTSVKDMVMINMSGDHSLETRKRYDEIDKTRSMQHNSIISKCSMLNRITGGMFIPEETLEDRKAVALYVSDFIRYIVEVG